MLTAIIVILAVVLIAFICVLFHLLSEENIKQHDIKELEQYQCKSCSYEIHDKGKKGIL